MGQRLCRISRVSHALADQKAAPIVHRKHAGTLPLPHRCRADSARGSAAPASPASSHFRSCSVSAVRCCGRPRSVRRCAASRAALRSYCNSMHYLRASTEGAVRIDLTGEPAGTVTAIKARHATECLAALAKNSRPRGDDQERLAAGCPLARREVDRSPGCSNTMRPSRRGNVPPRFATSEGARLMRTAAALVGVAILLL